MVQIKAYLLSLDYICLFISGYSLIDILNSNLAMSGIDSFVKLLVSMAGFVYLCARTYHFIMKSSIERDSLREDVIAKEIENHKNNLYKHMKSKLNEDNHENLKK